MSSKHEVLKGIVNEVFGVDIMERSRKREIVDARIVYSKILRDEGYALTQISRSLDRHHTTVLNYLNESDYAINNIRQLQMKYYACRESYDGKMLPFGDHMPYPKLVDKIAAMEKQLHELKEYKAWYEKKYAIH